MTLASLEAYALGDGYRKRKRLETLGYLWGYRRQDTSKATHFHVDTMSLSISAERSPNSVSPNEKAVRLKSALMDRWAPHLTLVGDFHSHPYKDRKQVEEMKGYEFSDQDVKTFLEDDFLWGQSGDWPLMLAMTICRLNRVHEKQGAEQTRWNVGRFDVGEFRFWINCAAGFLLPQAGGPPTRCWTGNARSSLELRLDTRFYNYSADRLLE